MRSTLRTRLARHQRDAPHFIDLKVTSMDSAGVVEEEDDGHPEMTSLSLPSHIADLLNLTERNKKLVSIEIELRQAKCLQSLQRLRTTALQKAQMLRSKKAHVRGETKSTRSQSMITRLSDRMEGAIHDYSTSRRALQVLAKDRFDDSRFKPLAVSDTAGLMKTLTADREPGEGYKMLPWFWSVRPSRQ